MPLSIALSRSRARMKRLPAAVFDNPRTANLTVAEFLEMTQGEDLAVEGVHIAFLDSLLRTPPSAAAAQDSRSVFGGASRTGTKENEMLFYMRHGNDPGKDSRRNHTK